MTNEDTGSVRPGRRWTRWAVQIGLVLAVLLALHWWQTRSLVSGVAPALAGHLLDGQPVQLEAMRGQPVLVHFWATWCSVCSMENDSIQALAQHHRVLTVAMGSGDAADLRAYQAEHGLDFPVVPDPDGHLSGGFGVRAVPTSIILDTEGSIRFTEVGYTTEWGLRVRLWLAGL